MYNLPPETRTVNVFYKHIQYKLAKINFVCLKAGLKPSYFYFFLFSLTKLAAVFNYFSFIIPESASEWIWFVVLWSERLYNQFTSLAASTLGKDLSLLFSHSNQHSKTPVFNRDCY